MGSFSKRFGREQKRRVRKEVFRDKRHAKSAILQTTHLSGKQILIDMVSEAEAVANNTTIMLLAANHTFKFGAKRLEMLRQKMFIHYECIKEKRVTVEDICNILRDETHLDIGEAKREVTARTLHDRHAQITGKALEELSACYLLALHDEFGFNAKRLVRGYHEASVIAKTLKEKQKTIMDLSTELDRIEMRGKVVKAA